MHDPAALDARAAALRSLAAEVDGCADRTVARASSPGWSSPNADDVRDRVRQAQSRARTAADALRDEDVSAPEQVRAEES